MGHLLHFSDTNNEIPEGESKKKKKSLLKSHQKKSLRINLTKEIKHLYAKNYKTLIKEIMKMIQ